jgi:hypothetical protein
MPSPESPANFTTTSSLSIIFTLFFMMMLPI